MGYVHPVDLTGRRRERSGPSHTRRTLIPVFDFQSERIEWAALDPYCTSSHRFVVILDADALLSSIDHHLVTGRSPRLLQIGESNAAETFASDHVHREVYRGFERMSLNRAFTAGDMRALFEERYLPVIRWVNTATDDICDSRVSEVTDPTDVPTAQLASLIAPCLVLAEDRSLRRPGFAPAEWRPAAGHGVVIIEASGQQQAAVLVMGLPIVGLVGGGVKLGQALQVPSLVTVALMAGGGYLLLRDPERRRTVGRKVWPVVEVFLEMMAEAMARQHVGERQLNEVMFQPAKSSTLKQQVATVLARTREPLLAREVQGRIEMQFIEQRTPFVAEVWAVLREGSEFTQPDRHRWQLGRLCDPRPPRS